MSAAQWMTDSSDDTGSEKATAKPATADAPGATATPTTTPTTAAEEDRRARLRAAEERRKEMQAKMAATLGEKTVAEVVESKKPTAAASGGPPRSPHHGSRVHPPAGTSPHPGRRGSLTTRDKLLRDSITSDDASAIRAAIPQLTQGDDHLPPPGGDEVAVLVADRGTQTATEISTQTDPDAHTLGCPMCYEGFYGHAPAEDGCIHVPPAYAHGPAASHGGIPLPFQPLRQPPMGSGITVGGARGAPVAYQSPSTAAAYQLQVDAILSQIDTIIARHNLPGVPM